MGKTVERKILIQMADPSGNKTAFVLSGARPEDYQNIARYIMEKTEYGAEQVAFVKSTHAFDMSGMEFCGNAARAFALMSAKGMIDGKASEETRTSIEISMSDGRKPIICGVDTESGHASASIPLPKRVKTLKHCDFKPAEGKDVIVMDGITHLIADDIEYSEQVFDQIRQAMQEQFDTQALGVMFLNTATLEMTPVVYVPAVNSTFIEGSCGSGSASAAYWLASHQSASDEESTAEVGTSGSLEAGSKDEVAKHEACSDDVDDKPEDGTYEYEIKQPAGTINASCVIADGEPRALYIEGSVELSDPEFITVEYESSEDEIDAMSNTW